MLEDKDADFTEIWLTGHGVYEGHGADFSQKILNSLQRTYFLMEPTTRCFRVCKKKHYSLVHPHAKTVNLVVHRRKQYSDEEIAVPSLK